MSALCQGTDCIQAQISLACAVWEERPGLTNMYCQIPDPSDEKHIASQIIDGTCHKIPKTGISCQCRYFTDIDLDCGNEPDTTVTFRTFSHLIHGRTGGKCLDNGGDSHNGDPLFMWDCNEANGQQSQRWAHFNGRIVSRGTNKCVDIPDGDISQGKMLQLWDCLDYPQQQFSYDNETGLIHVPGTELCVDSPGGGFNNADAVWLWDCQGSQAWDVHSWQEYCHQGGCDDYGSGLEFPESSIVV